MDYLHGPESKRRGQHNDRAGEYGHTCVRESRNLANRSAPYRPLPLHLTQMSYPGSIDVDDIGFHRGQLGTQLAHRPAYTVGWVVVRRHRRSPYTAEGPYATPRGWL